ncbi:MAG: pyridoxal phosphate-dependent aminotransferase [Chitinophagales bacterium]|jgi:aspartate aminotransferase|nr:pyridoxal phosphate-dependent aminotransferase [Chitinophagales bacterium]
MITNRIKNLHESATLKMAKLARDLKASGRDIISLSLGEPDFDTPQIIKEAAKKALDEGNTKYTAVAGHLALREAICHKLKRQNGLEYSPNQIVVCNGAKQAISNACMSLLNPGDEILIPAPYWVSYKPIAQLAEAIITEVPTTVEENYLASAKLLEANISEKTRAIIYSSPCNPTGSVYERHQLAEIAEMLEKYPNVFVLSDEIYEHINYLNKHESIAQFPKIKDRVVLINGFSKAYSMTGWRMGYTATNLELAQAIEKFQGQVTSGICNFNQIAGITALEKTDAEVKSMVEAFRKRKEVIMEGLREIPGIKLNNPQGAFYAFPDISSYFGKSYEGKKIETSSDMAMYILEVAEVGCVGGDDFAADKCIRFSFAASEEQIREAMKRVKAALEKLQ